MNIRKEVLLLQEQWLTTHADFGILLRRVYHELPSPEDNKFRVSFYTHYQAVTGREPIRSFDVAMEHSCMTHERCLKVLDAMLEEFNTSD